MRPVPGAVRACVDAPVPWQRPLPVFVADLSGGHLAHSLFSQNRVRHGTSICQLQQAWVFGSHHFHGFLTEQGDLHLQESDDDRVHARLSFLLSNPVEHRQHPLFEQVGSQDFVCSTRHLGAGDVLEIEGPVLFGSPVEPDNWGMWLLNGLSSAALHARHGGDAHYLCWVHQPWQRRLLAFMGVPPAAIIPQRPWQVFACNDVSFEQYSKVDLIPTASDMTLLAALRERCQPPRMPHFDKIFVSRRRVTQRDGYRALVNEAELVLALEAHGFLTVEPELLAFEDQIRLFAGARLVVGLGGAGLFNSVFCQPGTRIVTIEGSTAFVENHACLFAALGLQYGVVFGEQNVNDPAPVHKSWRIDVAAALRHILAFA